MAKKVIQERTAEPKPLSRIGMALPWILIVSGVIGLISSFTITIEKLDLLKNPNYHPICNLNPIISCGSVMQSTQANAFGFPNPFIGLVGFAVLVTIGVAILAGARFKRWFWLGLVAGMTAGLAFAYWLLFESVYRIRALCPYCLAVDVVVTITFWYVMLYTFQKGWLSVPKRLSRVGAFVGRHHLDILVLWFLIIITFIVQHFWYYFGRNF